MIRLIALFLSVSIALGGCLKRREVETLVPFPVDPYETSYTPDGELVAVALCDVETVAADMGSIEEFQASVQSAYIKQRLETLSTSIDAQYRSMTQACRAYQQCMMFNEQRAAECIAPQQRWDDAERRFRDLAGEVERLRAGSTGRRADRADTAKARSCERSCGDYAGLTSCCG